MYKKYSQQCSVRGANAEFLFVMRQAGPALSPASLTPRYIKRSYVDLTDS